MISLGESTKAVRNPGEQYMESSRRKTDPGMFNRTRNVLFLRHLRRLRRKASGQPREHCILDPGSSHGKSSLEHKRL